MYFVALYNVDAEYDRSRDDSYIHAVIEREYTPLAVMDWQTARKVASDLKDDLQYAGSYLQVWAHESGTEVSEFSGWLDDLIAAGKAHRLY